MQLTDEVPDGALEENADGSVNVYNKAGAKVGTATPEEVAEAEAQITPEEVQQAAAAARAEDAEKEAQQDKEPDEVEVHGVIRRVFQGKLRLRRAPSFEDNAICGVTMFTEKAVTKKIKVGEKTMYKTLDGYFVSGDPAHVKFI